MTVIITCLPSVFFRSLTSQHVHQSAAPAAHLLFGPAFKPQTQTYPLLDCALCYARLSSGVFLPAWF